MYFITQTPGKYHIITIIRLDLLSAKIVPLLLINEEFVDLLTDGDSLPLRDLTAFRRCRGLSPPDDEDSKRCSSILITVPESVLFPLLDSSLCFLSSLDVELMCSDRVLVNSCNWRINK